MPDHLPMRLPSFDLTGRHALITGGSSGLGEYFSWILAAAGARVTLAARRVDKLDSVVSRLTSHGYSAAAAAMDVTDRESVQQALKNLGPTHILINNAGVSATHRALDVSDSDWDAILNTNLKGAWIVAQETARQMIGSEIPGSIINVTSILANRVAGSVSPYCAAKAGLAHLTRALALELARHRIRVNSLAPGYIETPLNSDFLASPAGEKLAQRIPTRRFGVVDDLSGPLLLLASDASAYMTGSEIVVDGGHLCSSL